MDTTTRTLSDIADCDTTFRTLSDTCDGAVFSLPMGSALNGKRVSSSSSELSTVLGLVGGEEWVSLGPGINTQ